MQCRASHVLSEESDGLREAAGQSAGGGCGGGAGAGRLLVLHDLSVHDLHHLCFTREMMNRDGKREKIEDSVLASAVGTRILFFRLYWPVTIA